MDSKLGEVVVDAELTSTIVRKHETGEMSQQALLRTLSEVSEELISDF